MTPALLTSVSILSSDDAMAIKLLLVACGAVDAQLLSLACGVENCYAVRSAT